MIIIYYIWPNCFKTLTTALKRAQTCGVRQGGVSAKLWKMPYLATVKNPSNYSEVGDAEEEKFNGSSCFKDTFP